MHRKKREEQKHLSSQYPPPYISHGKISKNNEAHIKKHIDEITTPIFNKVLQETGLNPMMVGRVEGSKKIQWLWQPHNYRLYFDFDKRNFNPPRSDNPTLKKLKIRLVGFDYQSKNYGSEHHFNNFYGCRIVIKKTQVEVTNKSHNKQWRLMTARDIDDIGCRINEVTERLDKQCIEALKKIIKYFGGKSKFEILKKRCKGEHGVHGLDFLDKIPEDMVIHDTVFKKVYKKKVEYKSPVHVKNTVSNYAIHNIAPDIANELTIIKEAVMGTLKINADTSKVLNQFATSYTQHSSIYDNLAVNIKTHNKVLKGIDHSFRKFNRLLLERQKRLGDFLG